MGSLPCAWQPWAEPSLGSSSGNPSRDAEAAGEFPWWGEFHSSTEAEGLQERGQDGVQSPPSMVTPADSCFLLQAEIVKRLSAICAQIIPFLTQEVRRRQGGCSRLLWLLRKGQIKVQPEPREVLGKKTSMPGLEGREKGLCREGWGNVEPSAPSGQEQRVTTPVLFLPSTSSRSCRQWNGPSR